jgi:pteridine reductase
MSSLPFATAPVRVVPRRVFVAGATGTIGRAVSAALIARGDAVFAAGRDAKTLANLRAALGPTLTPTVVDLRDEAAVAELATSHAEVTDVVFAFGGFPTTPLATVTHDDFARAVVDHAGTFVTLVRTFSRSIARAAGAAIAFGDDGVDRPYPNHLAYLAAKGALLAVVRALSIELAPDVRVAAIRIGVVTDPDVGHPQRGARLAARSRLDRTGAPSEVAHAALSLLDATWTSGEEWGVGR